MKPFKKKLGRPAQGECSNVLRLGDESIEWRGEGPKLRNKQ